MYRIVFMLFGLMLTATLSASEVSSLADAKAKSAQLNKPILIDFMTEW